MRLRTPDPATPDPAPPNPAPRPGRGPPRGTTSTRSSSRSSGRGPRRRARGAPRAADPRPRLASPPARTSTRDGANSPSQCSLASCTHALRPRSIRSVTGPGAPGRELQLSQQPCAHLSVSAAASLASAALELLSTGRPRATFRSDAGGGARTLLPRARGPDASGGPVRCDALALGSAGRAPTLALRIFAECAECADGARGGARVPRARRGSGGSRPAPPSAGLAFFLALARPLLRPRGPLAGGSLPLRARGGSVVGAPREDEAVRARVPAVGEFRASPGTAGPASDSIRCRSASRSLTASWTIDGGGVLGSAVSGSAEHWPWRGFELRHDLLEHILYAPIHVHGQHFASAKFLDGLLGVVVGLHREFQRRSVVRGRAHSPSEGWGEPAAGGERFPLAEARFRSARLASGSARGPSPRGTHRGGLSSAVCGGTVRDGGSRASNGWAFGAPLCARDSFVPLMPAVKARLSSGGKRSG